MIKYVMLALLLLACPAGTLAPSAAQPPAPPAVIIVPGLGIGAWTLDQRLADYLFGLGVPVFPRNGTDLVFRSDLRQTTWPDSSVSVLYPHASDIIAAVGSWDSGAHTVERIGVGSSEDQISAAYGQPQILLTAALRSKTLIYDDRGVAFELPFVAATGTFGGTGRVFVFRPGQGRAVWRVP